MSDAYKLMTLGKLARKVKKAYTTLRKWVLLGSRNQFTGERVYLEAEAEGDVLESSYAAYLKFKRALNARG